MHTRLIAHLQTRASALASPQRPVELAEYLSERLSEVTPVGKTHNLLKNLTRLGPLRVMAEGHYQIGVGDIGPSDASAPRGTLAAFLADHREYRTRKNIPSRLAWWLLSPEAKDLLQTEREAGRYGAEPGKSPYGWVQDGTTLSGAAGAAKANIRPQGFIADALEMLREHIPDYVQGLLQTL